MKRYLALTLAALMMLVAFGASAGGEQLVFDTDPSQLEGTVTWWYWDEAGIQPMIEAFNEVYPKVTIEIVPVVNADYVKKVQTAVASGLDLPDILNAEMDWRGKILSYDIWEDLEAAPYNADTGKIMDYDQNLIRDENGKLCGFDNIICASGLAYKAALAQEYFGTDDPVELKALLPDWAAFAAKGKEVSEKSNGKVFMMTGYQDAGRSMFYQNPAPLVEDGKLVNFDTVVRPTLEKLIMFKQNNVCDMIDQWTPAWNASFAADDHIFYPCPSWMIPFVIKPNDPNGEGRWRVMEAPEGGFNYGGTMFGVSQTSKNKEAAWAFIQWTTLTDEGAAAYRDKLDYFVPRKDLYEGDAFDFSGREDPYFGGQNWTEMLYKIIPQGLKTRPQHVYDGSITEVLMLTEKVIEKDDSVTLDAACAYFKEELANKEPNLVVE